MAAQPFTRRNIERFGAAWLHSRAERVELLDLSLLAWEPGRAAQVAERDAVEGVLRPADWGAVEALLARHGPRTLALLYVDPNDALRPFFEGLVRHRLATLYFDSGRLPIHPRRSRNLARRLRSVAGASRRRVGRVVRRTLRSWPNFGVDYFVMGGRVCEKNPPPWLGRVRTRVPAHAYDYATWAMAEPFTHPVPYAVFLDQAYPEHGDPVLLKVKNPFSREVYYPQIERFLDMARAAYGMPVLVALHPRSPAEGANVPYTGFPTFRDRTAALVKGARLVIAHDTTAVSFVVLGRKPLLLVKADEMELWLAKGVLENMAEALRTRVVHIDSDALPRLEAMVVNERRYARYEATYIRHPASDGTLVWDHVFGGGAS